MRYSYYRQGQRTGFGIPKRQLVKLFVIRPTETLGFSTNHNWTIEHVSSTEPALNWSFFGVSNQICCLPYSFLPSAVIVRCNWPPVKNLQAARHFEKVTSLSYHRQTTLTPAARTLPRPTSFDFDFYFALLWSSNKCCEFLRLLCSISPLLLLSAIYLSQLQFPPRMQRQIY